MKPALHPVHLVGAGPGDPELLTLKAVRVLRAATVILVDDLVGQQVLGSVLEDCVTQPRVIHVGKRGGCASTPQDFIEKLMVREALAGERVVRLKGGDPLIFGRAGEEIEALRGAGLAVEIINGIARRRLDGSTCRGSCHTPRHRPCTARFPGAGLECDRHARRKRRYAGDLHGRGPHRSHRQMSARDFACKPACGHRAAREHGRRAVHDDKSRRYGERRRCRQVQQPCSLDHRPSSGHCQVRGVPLDRRRLHPGLLTISRRIAPLASRSAWTPPGLPAARCSLPESFRQVGFAATAARRQLAR
jgi:hypothetical protein